MRTQLRRQLPVDSRCLRSESLHGPVRVVDAPSQAGRGPIQRDSVRLLLTRARGSSNIIPSAGVASTPIKYPIGRTFRQIRFSLSLLDDHTYLPQFFEIRSRSTRLSTTHASDSNAKNTTRLRAVELRPRSHSDVRGDRRRGAKRIQWVYTHTTFRLIRTRNEDSTPAVRRTDGI